MLKKALLMAKTNNLGDDIQAWPAWQFWGRNVDAILERDTLDWWYPPGFALNPEQKVAIVFNGWFTHNPKGWFPPQNLSPLFISLHIAPEVAPKLLRPELIEYFSQFEIGTRDLSTLDLLRSYGLKAYFSGCLTLTVSRWFTSKAPSKDFRPLIVDLDSEILRCIPVEIRNMANYTHQEISRITSAALSVFFRIAGTKWVKILKGILPQSLSDSPFLPTLHTVLRLSPSATKSPLFRLRMAEERLRLFSSSSLILTSKLHVALPAASLGVPVILIHPKLRKDPRFAGLSDLVNSYTPEEFCDISQSLSYNKLSNPAPDKLRELRENLLKRLQAYQLSFTSSQSSQ